MKLGMNRREFLGATTAGGISLAAAVGAARAAVAPKALPPWTASKTRVGKVYIGARGGWPGADIDPAGDIAWFEAELAKLGGELDDIEWVDGGHVTDPAAMAGVKERFRDVDGIVVIHLSMVITPQLQDLLTLDKPVLFLSQPYMGHDWTTVPALIKQGRKIELVASTSVADLVPALRPIRAIHHLKQAKILSFRNGGPLPEYAQAIKDRFGLEIVFMPHERLVEAYKAVDEAAAAAEAARWMQEAERVVEPTREDVLSASRVYFAMKRLLEEERAHLVTIQYCMGIPGLDGAYPCLGFSRLNGEGLGGVCEGDLPSSVTQLVLMYLTPQRKPSFVTDPMFDFSAGTVIHAHCMCAVNMAGPNGEQSPYRLRCQREGNRGACLQVALRKGEPVTMAKLVDDHSMLVSTGTIVDVPDVDRACRTKFAVKVADARKMAENWHYGLHRVVVYGDHLDDIRRLGRFLGFKLLIEGQDEIVPTQDWVERDLNIYASYPI